MTKQPRTAGNRGRACPRRAVGGRRPGSCSRCCTVVTV